MDLANRILKDLEQVIVALDECSVPHRVLAARTSRAVADVVRQGLLLGAGPVDGERGRAGGEFLS